MWRREAPPLRFSPSSSAGHFCAGGFYTPGGGGIGGIGGIGGKRARQDEGGAARRRGRGKTKRAR